ncbi:MAG: carboxylesterase [Gammaproteobacteria bacterium HGW-Gammaproteobacteria-14]|nr:MAG: carboxylesterase [Gammaproteobacteria bacterium HGW-Gammaproteobacteria-14]
MIEIASGKLTGLKKQGVREYRGIPFAAPPMGENRFRAPQPVTPWAGVRVADAFRPAAWQQANPLMGTEQISDDCLYLNVWAPEGEGPFPVMVWVHGGAYTSGSPSQLLYQGHRLAASQQVVVVNITYRLGAWGFGWFHDVAPGLEADSNLGLRDQVAALQWVQENIAAFGGDPSRVTVFGESAGGFSVATLMATPAAKSLFQRAIVQSGAADFVLAPDQASRVTEALLAALPGEGGVSDRLRNTEAKPFVKAQLAAMRLVVDRGLRKSTPQFGMVYMPVVDGDFLPQSPVEAIAAGCAADKELMAGVCEDEWHLFQFAPPFNGGVGADRFLAFDTAEILRRMNRQLPGRAQQAFDLYQQELVINPRRGLMDTVSALETDRTFRVPTVRLLDAHAAAGGAAWGFRFAHEVEAFGMPLGACHVSDVPMVFGLTDTPAGQIFTGGGAVAAALSEQVMNAWGGFAQHGEPGWPLWREQRQARTFGPGESMTSLMSAPRETFWRDIIPAPA